MSQLLACGMVVVGHGAWAVRFISFYYMSHLSSPSCFNAFVAFRLSSAWSLYCLLPSMLLVGVLRVDVVVHAITPCIVRCHHPRSTVRPGAYSVVR